MSKYLAIAGSLAAICLSGCSVEVDTPETRSEGLYLGQSLPGDEPALFAPGIISTGMAERDFAMPPELDEIYYTAVLGAGFDFSAIVVTRLVDGAWTDPEVAEFSGRFKDLEPAISPDGTKLFFVSTRPSGDSTEPTDNEEIWLMDKLEDRWGEPLKLGLPVNTEQPEFFPSVTRDGSLYFT